MRTKYDYYSEQSTFKSSFPSVMHEDIIRSVHTFLSQAVMSYSLKNKTKTKKQAKPGSVISGGSQGCCLFVNEWTSLT